MQITFFSIWMTVFWSSILIVMFYVLRTKLRLTDLCSVSGVIVLYLFCMIRMLIPVEFPWTKVVEGGALYNRIHYFWYIEQKLGNEVSVYDVVCLVWIAGTVWILLRDAVQYIKISRYFGTMPAQRNNSAAQLVNILWKGSRKPDILLTAAVQTPCCFGILRKRILIPDKEYTDGQLRLILLHECAHLKNNDLLTKNLINILCALYWWNPCVYLLKKDLSQSLEIRCDLMAVKELDNDLKGEYLAVILKEYKDRVNTNSKLLLERFRMVAKTGCVLRKRGTAAAWVLAGALLMGSYTFVIQCSYDPPIEEIETVQEAHEINRYNSCLIKMSDGTYCVRFCDQDIPVSGKMSQLMIEDGFTVIEKGK